MGDAITIEPRAFLLRPETTQRERDKFVDYTQSWMRPAAMEPRAKFNVWRSDAPAPSGSIPAQVAAKAMTSFDSTLTEGFERALLAAYFTDNRDISDWQVLADIAGETGASGSQFADYLAANTTDLTQNVIDEHNEAVSLGITAVPTVVINDVFPVQGAQDVELYEQWIRKLIDRRTEA